MDELISRKATIEAINKITPVDIECDGTLLDQVDVKHVLDNMPSAEPKKIKGKWVGADTQCGIACSVCGVAVDDFCHSADYMDLDYEPNFCPNCGANMEE